MNNKKHSFGNFLIYIWASAIGDQRLHYKRDLYMYPAIIAIAVFIMLGTLGMQKAFYRIAEVQSYFTALEQGGEYLQYWRESKQESSGFLFWQQQVKEDESWIDSFVTNLVTIFALVVFLMTMGYLDKAKSNWHDAVITVGICSVPLTIGMGIGFVFLTLGDAFSADSQFPIYCYLIAAFFTLTACLTCTFVFYNNNHHTLKLTPIKRYISTILGIYIAIGSFAITIKYLV